MRYDLARRLLLTHKKVYEADGAVPVYALKVAIQLVHGCKERAAENILKTWDKAGLIKPCEDRIFWVRVLIKE